MQLQNESQRFSAAFVSLALLFALFDVQIGQVLHLFHLVDRPVVSPKQLAVEEWNIKAHKPEAGDGSAATERCGVLVSANGMPSRYLRLPKLRYVENGKLRKSFTDIGLGASAEAWHIDAWIYDFTRRGFVVRAGGDIMRDDGLRVIFQRGDGTCCRVVVNAAGRTEYSRWQAEKRIADGEFVPWTPPAPVTIRVSRNAIACHFQLAIPVSVLGVSELTSKSHLSAQLAFAANIEREGPQLQIAELFPALAYKESLNKRPGVCGVMPLTFVDSTRWKPPVRRDRPRTATPQVLFSADCEPSPQLRFPPLRRFDGEDWQKERTDIMAATDGKDIRIRVFAADAEPEKLVREHGDADPVYAFQDDSFELFFCPGPEHPYYYQVVVACTGVYEVRRLFNDWNGWGLHYADKDWTEAPKAPATAQIRDDGYVVEVVFPAAAFGLADLKPGDEFYMQIVRNYRGQELGPQSILLQLFPVHIYAAKHVSNHDRRSFGKVRVVSGAPPTR